MHLPLPHLPAPLLLLSVVYGTAIAVALADPGRHMLAALVVLAGFTARWVARHRRSVRSAGAVVPTPDAARAPSAAA